MTTSTPIPQTLTMMEACFTLAPGAEGEFWPAQERFGPVAAAAPGFRGVLGGPIANSSWLYFGGVFETPGHMDRWYHDRHHRVVQSKAYETWFDSYYIRKWRLPAEGEAVSGRVLVETSLGREEPLSEDELTKVLDLLSGSLPAYGPRPFETLLGQFEANPYQFVGPLEEAPPLAPARYLLLTHWDSPEAASRWADSSELGALAEFGELASRVFIPLYHQPGERNYLSPDGMHREWVRQA